MTNEFSYFKSQKKKTNWMAQYLTKKINPCVSIIMTNFMKT
jgi:hypothetical protein